MEREKGNYKKRKYIRLLVISLAFYNVAFASPSIMNMEYFPRVAHVSEFFIIKFYMDSKLSSTPKIVLNDGSFLEFETSNIFIENGNTVIENQYKIKKTGFIKLDHILLYIDEHIIEAPTIELEVQATPLSKDTQFRTRIFEYTESNDITKQSFYELSLKHFFTIGKQYFILIEGLFEKKEEQKISIQYELPNNAFMEKLKTYPLEFQMDETWKPIVMFSWIPLKKGRQPLPEFNLILDINKTQEYKVSLDALTLEVLSLEKTKIEKDSSKEHFQNTLIKELEETQTLKQNTEKEIEIAKQIKELRKQERNSFFYTDTKGRRMELERKLNLEDSFAVFHYKLFILNIIIAVIFLSYPIYKKIVKKKHFNFYDVLSFCVGILILTYAIKANDLRKEYIVINEVQNKIYTSPDMNSTIIENASLGETIKIIHNSKDWIFVETSKNIKGWMQNKEVNNEI